jgi:predicted RNase H-like HicB family nuclease
MTVGQVISTIPTYTVAVERQQPDRWVATALGWWNCEAEGETREVALANLNEKLAVRLAQVEILEQPLPVAAWSAEEKANPWLNVAGKYVDDEQFDQMLEHIAAYRQELDAEVAIPNSKDYACHPPRSELRGS